MSTSGSNKGRMVKTVILLALMAALSACSGKDEKAQTAQKPTAKPALTVRAVQTAPAQWMRTISANGSVAAWQEAIIGAQLPGLRIMEVKAGIGDWVRQGDVLLTLGNRTRDGGDYIQGRVIAPDDGVISAANASVGSTVQSGAELFRLIRKGRLEWRAELTADELMLVRKGMSAEITVGEGRTVKGRVRAISPSVDPQTRYGHALVDLPNGSGLIAGLFARGEIRLGDAHEIAQTLPQSAVVQRDGAAYVYAIGADGKVQERKVAIGQRFGDRIAIIAGLDAGVSVAESGGAFLTDGDLVQVVKE
ncbi:MAG: efflux RND transporter periplasmic adaptor subunit [Gallionella sp.]|nr:efflux RND transporter periplasmic adaptor subunit [Gallionella sp.]MCK9352995.1 efflux RND transporter periplasmic adaptor subunit [Gallionella sp.]